MSRGWLHTLLLGAIGLLSTTTAHSQNFDGDHTVRFGLFAQPVLASFGQTRPLIDTADAGGVLGGLSVGIDFRPNPHWVWGIELDAALGDARADLRTTVGVVNYGIDYLANLRGRFGVYADPNWLLYGTAGLSLLSFEAGAPMLSGAKAAATLFGLTVGGGIEYKWDHVALFAEYNFANFAATDIVIGAVRHEVDADVHTVRLGVKFTVGHDHHPDIGRHYDPLK